MTLPASIPTLTQATRRRLERPRTRGAFQPLDAARRQLGLLSVADGAGQARISWLVDLKTQVVEDARFLAFGDLSSHPIADVFTELARGRTVAEACRIGADQLDAALRDEPATPAFADPAVIAFVADLQARILAELPNLKLLPKPAEVVAYQRKRRLDWTLVDERWFGLSLLKKIGTIEAIASRVLRERLGEAGVGIAGLHDDFRVVVAFKGLPQEQAPTAAQFIEDALRGEVHPQLTVEAKP